MVNQTKELDPIVETKVLLEIKDFAYISNSSVISGISFQYKTDSAGDLTVIFNSGMVYLYKSVQREVYMDFLAAPSKGEFFNRKILFYYKFRKLN